MIMIMISILQFFITSKLIQPKDSSEANPIKNQFTPILNV